MSDDTTKDPGGMPENVTGGQSQEKDPEVTGGNNSGIAYHTYDKAVKEKKKLAGEVDTLKSQLAEIEQSKLSSEGKKDELIDRLKTQLSEVEGTLKTKQATYAYNSVTNQLKTEALKMKCKDTDALSKLVDLNALEIDDDFLVDPDNLKRTLEDAKKKYHYLFDEKTVKVADGTPAPVDTTKVAAKPKTVGQLSEALAKTL